jgi:hypothetical protein
MQHLYAELNKSEQVGTKLFSILTFISFAISLVGVNAIAIISTRKRRKEIAVRRVMGASEQGIVAVNTVPLQDSVLLDAGANLLYPSMQALCNGWEDLHATFQQTSLPA